MSNELEDSVIDKKIAAKRHKELIERLDKVAIALTKKVEPKNEVKNDDGILEAITELSKNILSLPKPEKPQVNVELNIDKLTNAILELSAKMDKSLINEEKIIHLQGKILEQSVIMNQPKETYFDIKKNEYTGSLVSVKATTQYIKPKAQA